MPRKKVKPTIAKREPGKRGAKIIYTVTPEMVIKVKDLSGKGLTQEQIYRYYGWGRDTWFDRCKKHPELRAAVLEGRSKTIAYVTSKLMELVAEKNLGAIIFYLKCRANFSELKPEKDHDPESDAPNVTVFNVTDPIEAAKIYQQIMLRE